MWREIQSCSPNILTEIIVRIVLLGVVCVMHLNLHPHMQYITEAELMLYYKRPRADSIAPTWVMIVLTIFVPLVTFSIPYLLTKHYGDTSQAMLAWSLACAINAFVTETGKLIVGRPRPDFFYRCFPNGRMTRDLRCTGNLKDVIDGRKSFPSGHSSFSFCSLGFMSVWLCGKFGVLSRNRGEGLRIITCLVPLVAAAVVAMSRCCDNHHHWEDVFAGSLVGLTSCYFCYRQYFLPLDSINSGTPLVFVTREELFCASSEDECCTRDLNEIKTKVDNITDKKK